MHADRNLFPGIKPLLNSHLQQPNAGWDTFHARHTGIMVILLDQVLPSRYYALETPSLQQREFQQPDDRAMMSVGIYDLNGGKAPGQQRVHIEHIAPWITREGQATHYAQQRSKLWDAEIRLVELWYVSEIPFATDESVSYEVRMYHPSTEKDQIYEVDLLQSLPTITIPLSKLDGVRIDLQAVYNQVIASSRLFQMLVDYDTLPVNLDRYTPADQDRIRDHLTHIRTQNQGAS